MNYRVFETWFFSHARFLRPVMRIFSWWKASLTSWTIKLACTSFNTVYRSRISYINVVDGAVMATPTFITVYDHISIVNPSHISTCINCNKIRVSIFQSWGRLVSFEWVFWYSMLNLWVIWCDNRLWNYLLLLLRIKIAIHSNQTLCLLYNLSQVLLSCKVLLLKVLIRSTVVEFLILIETDSWLINWLQVVGDRDIRGTQICST